MIESILSTNFIVACDSYKESHPDQYPKDTQFLYSSIVPRKPSPFTDEIVAAGVNYLASILVNTKITRAMIDEAEIEINEQGYTFHREMWEFIADKCYGDLPLMVCGVPEGTVVKPQTPLVAIMNTVPGYQFAALASRVETMAQRIVWKMSTVASISRYCYKQIEEQMIKTGADMTMLEYKLHNFGDRGADGYDASIMAAIAHGMLFSGSDCLAANRYIKSIYRTKKPYLSSIDATEHSTMCSNSDAETKDDWGAAVMVVERLEAAVERYKRGIGIPLQAGVIDTYDDERFVREYLGKRLKKRIINSGGTLVARPDSGNPLIKPIDVVRWLDEAFGSTVNDATFKVLHPSVRAIQGDGINVTTIPLIMNNLVDAGYSMDNLNFGMGGGLTHEGSRDLFSFSMKATARYDGQKWVNLLKSPKSDLGKKSLTGIVYVKADENGDMVVCNDPVPAEQRLNKFWQCYYDGKTRVTVDDYDVVRQRARA